MGRPTRGYDRHMTTKPFEPSRTDPGIRPDTDPDGTPLTTPGLDPEEPNPVRTDPSDPEPETEPAPV
jgi:hypothetical protein